MNEDTPDEIKREEIHRLLESFSKSSYRVRSDQKVDPVAEKCLKLFGRDYQFTVINNNNGELCPHYPSKIVVLEYEKSSSSTEKVESLYDGEQMKEKFKQARFARCRSRFVLPVIIYKGKHVCRSATLSSGAEMYSRSGLDFLMTGADQGPSSMKSRTNEQSDMQMFDRVRGQDINILKMFGVKYIVDLMVEKKKVKFGMNVTSSEKVDKENRYGEFCIISVPYPGCEFFKEWKENAYMGEGLLFDWTQSFVDACLDIPPTEVLRQLSIDWEQYRDWNLIQITQNYLKMMVHVLAQGDRGVLVHCISGWDRTPMFVSLLRLTLWADGVIHKSLTATEILYLTLAYDWYMFGHNLSDRLNRGEEILLFCFSFLANITSEEYSIHSFGSSKYRKPPGATENGLNGVCRSSFDNKYHKGVRRHLDSSSSSLRSLDGRRRTSSASSTSSAGSFSTEPAFFLTKEEDDVELSLGNGRVHAGQADSSAHFSVGGTYLQATPQCHRSSSPLSVPVIRSAPMMMAGTSSDSPTCGSWQVISNTGSLLSTDNCSASSRISSCEEAPEMAPVSERWERLESVRRIFNNAYSNKITAKFKPDNNGLTNFIGSFAEKVGFKQK